MKGKLAFVMFFFCVFLAFAEVSNNALGIPDTQLNTIITEYLEGIFNRYLRTTGLRVTELSFTSNMYKQTAETDRNLFHFNVQGRFRNFPINNRRLSGRLETTIAVRRNAGNILGVLGRPGVEGRDNPDLNISLLVDDLLSDELRDAMIRNYITRNYENPLGIDINRERVEIYPDRIFSYVTAVVNNDSIAYLRVVFEKQPSVTEKIDVFSIIETPWQLNRAEIIFSEKLPSHDSFKEDIRADMFEPMRGYYFENDRTGRGNPNRNLSKIESITRTEPKEANNGLVKIELNLVYLLDWWLIPGTYQRYNVIVNAYYQFNFAERKWEYRSIEAIDPSNITPIRRGR